MTCSAYSPRYLAKSGSGMLLIFHKFLPFILLDRSDLHVLIILAPVQWKVLRDHVKEIDNALTES